MCCPGAGIGTINFGLYQRLREMGGEGKAQELASVALTESSYAEQNLKVILLESKKSGSHAHKIAETLGIYPC